MSHPSTPGDLIRQPGGLRLTSRLPGYRGGLRHSQGHPVMTSTPSVLSLRYSRVLPPSIRREPRCVRPGFFPHRHWPSDRREIPGNSICPANQLHAGSPFFRRFIRSLSLRPYSLLASRDDRTRAARRPLCTPRLLRPGFQIAGSPQASAGYDYGAKPGIAPAGLSPASTAASLAAPFPQRPRHDGGMTWRPPRSRCSAYVRAWVLGHRGIPARLAISAGRMLSSAEGKTSTSRTIIFSVLALPAHAPVNA